MSSPQASKPTSASHGDLRDGAHGVHQKQNRRLQISWWAVAAVVLILPSAGLTALSSRPWNIGTPWVQLLSGYPLTFPLSVLALVAAVLAFRKVRRRAGSTVASTVILGVTIAVLAAQSLLLAPRIIADPRVTDGATEPPTPRSLSVMALNVGSGGWDVPAITAAVTDNNVDLLALPELGPLSLEALEAGGLSDLLPYSVTDVDWADTGSGVFSRFPLEAQGKVPGSVFNQSRALLSVDQGPTLAVTAVHVDSPRPGHTPFWRTELAQLADQTGSAAATILLGDFNATLDHPEFRALVAAGFTDAAAATGQGLSPTWPHNSALPAFAALDHILVSPTIGISAFRTVVIPGTDHAGVVAELTLPG